MKKYIYSFIVLFFTLTGVLKADIYTGLQAHYEFNGNGVDIYSNEHNLTSYGTITYSSGKFGQAVDFSPATGAYFKSDTDSFSASTTFSYAFWVKASLDGSDQMILQTMDGVNTSNRQNSISISGSGTKLYMWDDTLDAYASDTNTSAFIDGTWHHVVVTQDGSGVKLYVDGSEIALNVTTGAQDLLGTLYIGTRSDNLGIDQLNGLIDDLRVYNRELNATDVVELYNYPYTSIDVVVKDVNQSALDISSIEYVGVYGNSDSSDINGSSSLSDGDSNLSIEVTDTNASFSVLVTSDSQEYWYNFDDGNLYKYTDLNTSFVKTIDTLGGTITMSFIGTTINDNEDLPNSLSSINTAMGERIYNLNTYGHTRLDSYTKIDSDYFDNSVSGIELPFNPAYNFWYEHREDSDRNSTKLNLGILNMDDPSASSGTWSFNEESYEDGSSSTDSENGTFTKDASNVYTLKESDDTVASEKMKFGDILSSAELTTLISADFTDISFTSEDKAVMVYFKQLVDEVNTWGNKVEDHNLSDSNTTVYYTNFGDFITNNSSNGSWFLCQDDSNCSGSGGIGFSANSSSSDTNGTLVLNDSNGTQTLSNAGSWYIEDDVMYINPTVSGFDTNRIYKLIDAELYYGEFYKAGYSEASLLFNSSALAKISEYFLDEYNNLTDSNISSLDYNITGTSNDDNITGTVYDDTILATGGFDYISGSLGDDTLVLNQEQSNYTITDNGDGTYTIVDATVNVMTVENIEYLEFSDTSRIAIEATTTKSLKLKTHGGAVQFDGVLGNKINLGDIEELNSASSFTIETWIKVNKINGLDQYFFSKFSDYSNRINLAIEATGRFSIAMANNANQYTYSTNTLNEDEWYHVAFVYDGDASTLDESYKLYINGILETNYGSSSTFSPNSANLSGIDAYLGSSVSTNESNVVLDEFRIWSRARTNGEIYANMNRQLKGTEDDLVAYYNFDERLGNYVYDVSGNGYTATVNGSISRLDFLGHTLEFDGIDDYISLSTPRGIDDNLAIAGDITICQNFNISDLTNDNYLVVFAESGEVEEDNILYSARILSTGKLKYKHEYDLAVDENSTGTYIFEENKWYNVCLVRENNTIKSYVNGEIDIDSNFTNAPTGGTGSIFRIGSYIDGTSLLNGKISQVSIWKEALSQTDIKELMYSAPDFTDTNLVGYWPLNDGEGSTTVKDYSLYSNDGIITSASWVDTAPTIYGDTIYTTQNVHSFESLHFENNSSNVTYDFSGAPSYVSNALNTLGVFTYAANSTNTSFSVSASDSNTTESITINHVIYDNPYVNLSISLSGLDTSEHNVTSVILVDSNSENTQLSGSGDTWNVTDVLKGIYKVLVKTDGSDTWWYNFYNEMFTPSKDNTTNQYDENFDTSGTYTLNASKAYWGKDDMNVSVFSGTEDWTQSLYNYKYWENTFTDTGSYATITVDKISGTQSIFSMTRDASDTMTEISMEVELRSIDKGGFVIFKAVDIDGYTHQITINSQQALASTFYGSEELKTENIYDIDTSDPFDGQVIKLNMWILNGTLHFNMTDKLKTQIGRLVKFYSTSPIGFSSYGLTAILDSASSLSSMEFRYKGITESSSPTNVYYKRFPMLEYEVLNSYSDAVGSTDTNNSIWYQFEGDEHHSSDDYFAMKVGVINPIDSVLNETEVYVNNYGVVKKEGKSQDTISIDENNIITLDSDEGEEEVKYIGQLSYYELDSIVSTLGLANTNGFTFSTGGGYELILKRKETTCEIHYTDTYNTYDSKVDMIADYTYNSNSSSQNYITQNRFDASKAIIFDDYGTLQELDLLTNSVIGQDLSVGTYTDVPNVSCTKDDGSTITLDILDMQFNDGVYGYEHNDFGYKNGVRYDVEYHKAGDEYKKIYFDEAAISELMSNFGGVSGTPVKKVKLTNTYNYLSLPSKMILCTSNLQSASVIDCDGTHTIESVFANVDTVFKHTGFWSYWEDNVSLSSSSSYDMNLLNSISNKEGFVVKVSDTTTIELPYNIYGTIETDVIDLYQTGWFLTGFPTSYGTTKVKNMINSQGKTLKYMLNLSGTTWSVHSPTDDANIDQSLPRMNSVESQKSYWIYVE